MNSDFESKWEVRFLPLLVAQKCHKRPGSSLAKIMDCLNFKLSEAQEKGSRICCFLKFYGDELCALCSAASCFSLSDFLSILPPSVLCLGTSNLFSLGSWIDELRWQPPFLLTKATIIDEYMLWVPGGMTVLWTDIVVDRSIDWVSL